MHVKTAFITEGCDFQPFLQTVQQHYLSIALVRHQHMFNFVQQAMDNPDFPYTTIFLSKLFICMSYYEQFRRSGWYSASSITRPHPLPNFSSLHDVRLLPILDNCFHEWKHDCLTTTSLHHLIPFNDAITHHHNRTVWALWY